MKHANRRPATSCNKNKQVTVHLPQRPSTAVGYSHQLMNNDIDTTHAVIAVDELIYDHWHPQSRVISPGLFVRGLSSRSKQRTRWIADGRSAEYPLDISDNAVNVGINGNIARSSAKDHCDNNTVLDCSFSLPLSWRDQVAKPKVRILTARTQVDTLPQPSLCETHPVIFNSSPPKDSIRQYVIEMLEKHNSTNCKEQLATSRSSLPAFNGTSSQLLVNRLVVSPTNSHKCSSNDILDPWSAVNTNHSSGIPTEYTDIRKTNISSRRSTDDRINQLTRILANNTDLLRPVSTRSVSARPASVRRAPIQQPTQNVKQKGKHRESFTRRTELPRRQFMCTSQSVSLGDMFVVGCTAPLFQRHVRSASARCDSRVSSSVGFTDRQDNCADHSELHFVQPLGNSEQLPSKATDINCQSFRSRLPTPTHSNLPSAEHKVRSRNIPAIITSQFELHDDASIDFEVDVSAQSQLNISVEQQKHDGAEMSHVKQRSSELQQCVNVDSYNIESRQSQVTELKLFVPTIHDTCKDGNSEHSSSSPHLKVDAPPPSRCVTPDLLVY